MAQGLPHAIAAALFAATVVHCSLTAPSDQELMGGNKGSGDAGRSDAMDGSSGGSSSGGSSGSSSGGQCNQTGDCCATTSDCCSGLACEPNSGVCIPCSPSGESCYGGANNTCCSGSCVSHACQ
ncbi:MAG TPA: hypothetical protein VMI75_08955 [Polyangiaceae bacterium]|nr:hypothetical protein [Polyangiaceae bacterium]